jgi:hypothetical protein
MRTTVDLRDDLLQAAREEAARTRTPMGAVLSDWAERGRYAPLPNTANSPTAPLDSAAQVAVNGFRVVLPKRREVVTVDHVRRLMDEEGI